MEEGPWRITFDTNPDSCNIHCIMCEEHSEYRKEKKTSNRVMKPDIISEVVANAAPHGLKEIIPSTMGEPLLYRHFDKLLELANEHGLKINLTTNGTFPGRGDEQWGNQILPLASDIKVSINGSSNTINESIMKGIDHETTLENIRTLIRIRDELRDKGTNWPTITFQVTFMKKNIRDLKSLLQLAIDHRIDRFKGHHLWITWPELEEESLTGNVHDRIEWNRTVDELVAIGKDRIELANVSKIPIDSVDNLLPEHYECPFAGKEAWIAWDGTFNVCCAPDELRKGFGYFGNVKDTPFMELWQSDKYQSFIRHAGKDGVCRNCNMRRPVEGSGN
ncbi:radical SAM protein [Methanolobus vulcani]|nr:radical SAM protein [Methanolobus vulcani]